MFSDPSVLYVCLVFGIVVWIRYEPILRWLLGEQEGDVEMSDTAEEELLDRAFLYGTSLSSQTGEP